MNAFTLPGFTAAESLYHKSQLYQFGRCQIEVMAEPGVTPQQHFVSPGPLPSLLRCGPCVDGKQLCCPPPGFGLRCLIRRCVMPP
jgi:hypothetical protein